MKTFKRICIKNLKIIEDGKVFELKRGKEYMTSAEGEGASIQEPKPKHGHVVVFSNYWVSVPTEYFAGEIKFTD